MLEIIIFILASSGMTWILANGSIFNKIRPKHHFFKCSACLGFHSGWIMFLLFYVSKIYLFPNFLIGLFVYGCISSLTSYLFDRLVDDDGLRINLFKAEGENKDDKKNE